MTAETPAGTDDEGVDWTGADAPDWQAATAAVSAELPVTYPEYGPLPEAPISINFRPGDRPQITVRGHSAAVITAILNDLEAGGVYANVAAAMASLNAQGPLGAGLGPVSPVAPPAAPPAGPVTYAPPPGAAAQPTPPPFGANVSVPGAPGYQGPPQQQWQQAAPQSGGWSGGGGSQGSGPQPRPDGWLKMTVGYPGPAAKLKELRAQGTETGNYLARKIKWGDKGGIYWVEPSVAGWLAQQGFPVTQ